MRVLLIHTNQFEFGQLPRAVEKQRGLNPPISLAYIGAAIKHAGYCVRIVDMDAEKISVHQLELIIRSFGPDLVGFSVMLNNLFVILSLSYLVKKINPSITIVYGGIQMNSFPEEMIQYPPVDIGVIGEGEFTIVRIISHLEQNKPLDDINGIIFKSHQKIIRTPDSRPIDPLDELPFPARELLPIKKYTSLIAHRTPITLLFTSRGCPYQCSFCSKPDFWAHWRFHSPKYVADEFEACSNMGIKEIMVYDDVFTINKTRVKAICKEIMARRLDILWNIRTRLDLVDFQSLKWLKAAGCYRICYGVESGDPHILSIYNKGITIPQAKNAFDLTRRMGLETLAYFMIGGPDETERSVRRTFRAITYLDPDYIHLTHVIPYPKTKLFDMAVQRGLVHNDTWLNIKNHSYDSFPMFTDGPLTRKEIFQYVKKGYRIFYFRPQYLWRKLSHLASFSQLFRFINGFISL